MSSSRDPGRGDAREYWNGVADEKTFTHPLRLDWLRAVLPPDARLLEVGCGHGRLCAELVAAGWPHVVGVDTAERMVARGARQHPGLDLRTVPPGPLPFEDGSFDGALLVSVLTCVPDDGDQTTLMRELERVLRPGAAVFFSDLGLQEDERNRARYLEARALGAPMGSFRLPERGGVWLRHFTEERLSELFARFTVLRSADLEVRTMNGHGARAVQRLLRRGPGEGAGRTRGDLLA